MFLDSWFVINFERWPGRIWNLPEKIGLGCQNYFLCVQRNTYRVTLLTEIVQSFRVFGWVMKFLGHWRKFFFRVAKQEKNVQRKILRKVLSKKGKNTKFVGFWANSSVHSVEKVRQSCQNCNLRSLGRLWGKRCLKLCTLFQISLEFETKKIGALFRKLFSELSQMPSARPQESFAENQLFYQRNYVFC